MVEYEGATLKTNALDGTLRNVEKSTERCEEIGVFCQGFAPNDNVATKSAAEHFYLRELPLLRHHDFARAFVKDCPGNLAFYQLARNPVTMSEVKSAADAKVGFAIKYHVEAMVNFNQSDQIWYRDSQLFDGSQINEFSTEINQWDGSGDEPDNFIQWVGDKNVKIGVTVKFLRRIPGFYTVLSKMVDVLGQPVLEFNWNLRFSTGDAKLDSKLHGEVSHEKFVRENSNKIASMWGRSISNAVNRKGLENLDFTFNANELKSPAEKRAEMRGHTPEPK